MVDAYIYVHDMYVCATYMSEWHFHKYVHTRVNNGSNSYTLCYMFYGF